MPTLRLVNVYRPTDMVAQALIRIKRRRRYMTVDNYTLTHTTINVLTKALVQGPIRKATYSNLKTRGYAFARMTYTSTTVTFTKTKAKRNALRQKSVKL